MDAVPESDDTERDRLFRLFVAAPPRPGSKIRHGARPGEVETFENGRWVAMKTILGALVVAMAISIPSANAGDECVTLREEVPYGDQTCELHVLSAMRDGPLAHNVERFNRHCDEWLARQEAECEQLAKRIMSGEYQADQEERQQQSCPDPETTIEQGWRGDPDDHARFHCAVACIEGDMRKISCSNLENWPGGKAKEQCAYCDDQ